MPISNVPPPGAGIPGWKPMKKVIEGKVYSTESSTLIHEENFSEQEDHPHPFVQQMYRTRLGKFFLVHRNEEFFNGNIDDVDRQDRIIPLTQEQAVNWMEKHCNEKITNYVQLPEAGDPSTTLTLRLGKFLKLQLSAASVGAGVSMNSWCVRVLEAALNKQEQGASMG